MEGMKGRGEGERSKKRRMEGRKIVKERKEGERGEKFSERTFSFHCVNFSFSLRKVRDRETDRERGGEGESEKGERFGKRSMDRRKIVKK